MSSATLGTPAIAAERTSSSSSVKVIGLLHHNDAPTSSATANRGHNIDYQDAKRSLAAQVGRRYVD